MLPGSGWDKVVHRQGQVGEGLRADAVAGAASADSRVLGAGRGSVGRHLVRAQVHNPHLWDASGGVPRQLRALVIRQRTVGEFDNQVHLGRRRPSGHAGAGGGSTALG